MPSVEEIRGQETLLATHRATLRIRLNQLAAHGNADAPPVVLHDIDRARDEIRRIKASRFWFSIDSTSESIYNPSHPRDLEAL